MDRAKYLSSEHCREVCISVRRGRTDGRTDGKTSRRRRKKGESDYGGRLDLVEEKAVGKKKKARLTDPPYLGPIAVVVPLSSGTPAAFRKRRGTDARLWRLVDAGCNSRNAEPRVTPSYVRGMPRSQRSNTRERETRTNLCLNLERCSRKKERERDKRTR